MISVSTAKSRVSADIPSQTAIIEFEELCCICEMPQKDGQFCYRHGETSNIFCLKCAEAFLEEEERDDSQ